ncbi:phage antirepressor KilAC domain-containing protein [Zooshikella harenae]|uniref:phage antirepressor KilAC domain-containing protein n=1 Tax=Zooshikella harenae TaxID=2827238 RepID=UPI0028168189|nr:phage antirepressor KilAC domain-containing protein [Zooshikella harenae]
MLLIKRVGEIQTPINGGLQTAIKELEAHNVCTNAGPRELSIINESGLYSAILKSRRSEAKKFKKWVTKEVLPSIRKHGAYINGQEIDDQKIVMAKALLAVESMLKSKNMELEVAEEYIDEAKPKVEFYDDVTQAYDAITVGEAAKILGTGRNRLYAELRLNGWLNQNNEPYQHVIEKGYLDAKLTQFNPDKEGLTSSVAPFVTGKGLTVLQRMRTLEQAA